MVKLGYKISEEEIIQMKNNYKYIWVVSPYVNESYQIDNVKFIKFDEIINYVYFYDILQHFDDKSLIIYIEPLRKKRYDLAYNCIRQYNKKSKNFVIYSYLPIVENKEDFLILKDLNNPDALRDNDYTSIGEIEVNKIDVKLIFEVQKTSKEEKEKYFNKKNELINNWNGNDPYTIPRELQKFASKFKTLDADKKYVFRNKNKNNLNWNDINSQFDYIVEFPNRVIHLYNYIQKFEPEEIKFLLSDLPVDDYYKNKYQEIFKNVKEIYAGLGL